MTTAREIDNEIQVTNAIQKVKKKPMTNKELPKSIITTMTERKIIRKKTEKYSTYYV